MVNVVSGIDFTASLFSKDWVEIAEESRKPKSGPYPYRSGSDLVFENGKDIGRVNYKITILQTCMVRLTLKLSRSEGWSAQYIRHINELGYEYKLGTLIHKTKHVFDIRIAGGSSGKPPKRQKFI